MHRKIDMTIPWQPIDSTGTGCILPFSGEENGVENVNEITNPIGMFSTLKTVMIV